MVQISALFLLTICAFHKCYGQEEKNLNVHQIQPFIAYELGEAAFNNFQSFSGEIGLRLKNNHILSLVHMNVNLTEKHLSSSFAGSVKGNNVRGKFYGFEAFYGFPVLVKGLYIHPSIGYYKNSYIHTYVNEYLEKESATLGVAISFIETDIFHIKGLYYKVLIPFRTSFNPIKETKLGATVIKNNWIDNNIWLFIGYEF